MMNEKKNHSAGCKETFVSETSSLNFHFSHTPVSVLRSTQLICSAHPNARDTILQRFEDGRDETRLPLSLLRVFMHFA